MRPSCAGICERGGPILYGATPRNLIARNLHSELVLVDRVDELARSAAARGQRAKFIT
jgi:hypothetical protein